MLQRPRRRRADRPHPPRPRRAARRRPPARRHRWARRHRPVRRPRRLGDRSRGSTTTGAETVAQLVDRDHGQRRPTSPPRRASTNTMRSHQRRRRGADRTAAAITGGTIVGGTATAGRATVGSGSGAGVGSGSWISTPSSDDSARPAWATTTNGSGRADPSRSGRIGDTVTIAAALAPPASSSTDGCSSTATSPAPSRSRPCSDTVTGWFPAFSTTTRCSPRVVPRDVGGVIRTRRSSNDATSTLTRCSAATVASMLLRPRSSRTCRPAGTVASRGGRTISRATLPAPGTSEIVPGSTTVQPSATPSMSRSTRSTLRPVLRMFTSTTASPPGSTARWVVETASSMPATCRGRASASVHGRNVSQSTQKLAPSSLRVPHLGHRIVVTITTAGTARRAVRFSRHRCHST